MKINELVEIAHKDARANGWWETSKSPLEVHALITTEIAEATEAVRSGEEYPIYQKADNLDTGPLPENLTLITKRITPDSSYWSDYEKPEGELVELADAIIRIADYCGFRGWDLEQAIKKKMTYNRTRPYRHGGKVY